VDPPAESVGRCQSVQPLDQGRAVQRRTVEGSKLKDPAAFSRRINDLMAKDLTSV
jgi:hypothetical protein